MYDNDTVEYISSTQLRVHSLLTKLESSKFPFFESNLRIPLDPKHFLSASTLKGKEEEADCLKLAIKSYHTLKSQPHKQNLEGSSIDTVPSSAMLAKNDGEKTIFPVLVTNLTLQFKNKTWSGSNSCLVLLDSASDASYITKKALSTIPPNMYYHAGAVQFDLFTLGRSAELGAQRIVAKVCFGQSQYYEMTFLVVDSIASATPFSCLCVEREIGKARVFYKRHFETSLGQMNHYCFLPGKEIDLLLAAKFHDKLTPKKKQNLFPEFPDLTVIQCPIGDRGNIFYGTVQTRICQCKTNTKSFSASLNKFKEKTTTRYPNELKGDAARLESVLLELFRAENLDASYALDSTLKLEDRIFLEIIGESCQFLKSEGRYQIRLPFLDRDPPHLKNNYELARNRFLSTEKRLMNMVKEGHFKPEAIAKIDNSLLEHIESGRYVELPDQSEAAVSDPQLECFYLPLRLVFNPRSTSTPIRACLDASSPSGNRQLGFGPSLNSCLLSGLCTLPQQTSCHATFRRYKFAFGLDLSRFFLSINIFPDHQRFQRFCFRKFGSKDKLKAYQIRSVCWGLNSSPAACSLVLKKHCKSFLEHPKLPHHKSKAFIAAVDSLIDGKSIYADNILQSCETLEAAVQRVEYLEEIFSSGGFVSSKYFATDPRILKNLPPEKRCQDNLILFHSQDGSTEFVTGSARLLGETFCFSTDSYRFGGFDELYNKYADCVSVTKRDLASCMARIAFGHIQYRAPYSLYVKTILMQLALQESKEIEELRPDEKRPTVSQLWGRDLSPQFLADFKTWINFLPELDQLRLPRYLPCVEKPFPCKIISFADAGNFSCCSVSYCVSYDPFQKKQVSNFVMARVRTKPLALERINNKRPFTIPRLEMIALSLAHKHTLEICQDLGLDPKTRAVIYSDSTCALAWCQTPLRSLSLWHHNKVQPIQSSGVPLRYCISELNSADMGTKIISPECLKGDLWKHGPNFLRLPESQWPKMDPSEKIDRKSAVFLDGLVKNSQELSFFIQNYKTKTVKKSDKLSVKLTPNWMTKSFAIIDWLFEKSSMFFQVVRRLGCYLFIYYKLKINAARRNFVKAHKRDLTEQDEKNNVNLKILSLQEGYTEARFMIFFWHQRETFKDEMTVLLDQIAAGIPLGKGRVDQKSRLFQLNPQIRFMGRTGIPVIFSEGRVSNKVLLHPGQLNVKNIRLDTIYHRAVKDLVRQLHISEMAKTHLSKKDLVAAIRAQKVHVLRMTQTAKYFTSICGGCARHHSRKINQIMSGLPKELSDPDISKHGQLAVQRYLSIDHCGEFRISSGNPFQRRVTRANAGIITVHILLISCLTAGHLSLYIVPSVNASWTSFCLKNHANTYVTPWRVYLDNAPAYQNIGNALEQYFADPENRLKLESSFSRSPTQIDFVYGRPLFSAGQGRIERAVQTVKKGLRTIHGHHLFSYYSLATALSDIQAIVNSRPLCQINEFHDSEDVHKTVLTPKMLLFGQCDSDNPGFDIFDALQGVKKDTNLAEQWRFRTHLARQFTDFYQKEVLLEKEVRSTWEQATKNIDQIKPGSVILFPKAPSQADKDLVSTLGGAHTLKDTFHGWPCGTVKHLLRGRDQSVRGVVIKLPGKVEFVYKNGKRVMKEIEGSLLTRSINSCRLLPAYNRLQELEEALSPIEPKQSAKTKQVPKHEMTLRSHRKNEVNTFFGVQNDLSSETKFRLHDKSLERQLHLDSNFFIPMFKWTENPRDKSLLSRKEKILTRLASTK